jgi:hypothetical protein
MGGDEQEDEAVEHGKLALVLDREERTTKPATMRRRA